MDRAAEGDGWVEGGGVDDGCEGEEKDEGERETGHPRNLGFGAGRLVGRLRGMRCMRREHGK